MLVAKKDVNEILIVEIYSPPDKIIDDRPSRLIDFIIDDAMNKCIKCTVWDKYVDYVIVYFNTVIEGPLVILIQLCQTKDVTSELFFSFGFFLLDIIIFAKFREERGEHICQLMFDYDLQEFDDFKRILCGIQIPVQSISSISRLSTGNTMGELHSGAIEVHKIADLYAKKEYRLILRVCDPSFNASFLIWDYECSDLVGMAATQLNEKLPENNVDIPEKIEVSVKKEQFKNFNSAFIVVKVVADLELASTYYSTLDVEHDNDLLSNMVCGDAGIADLEMELSDADEADSPVHLGDSEDIGSKVRRCQALLTG
nr:replication protein A 70 kDa DNA-binding subunit B-like [Ipomoea batatas]